MSRPTELERLRWFSSAMKTLGELGCVTCHGYLNGVSKFAWIFVSSDGDAGLEREGSVYVVDLQLHSSSPIFPDVFSCRGTVSQGQYQGRCSSCGREYQYEYQPKSGKPGRLRIGCRAEPEKIFLPPKQELKTVTESVRPPRSPNPSRPHPKLNSRPGLSKTTVPILSDVNLELSVKMLDEHKALLQGPPPGDDWAQKLEHTWTARLDLKPVFFYDLVATPQILWLEVRCREGTAQRTVAIGLHRLDGHAVYRSKGRLSAKNPGLVKYRSRFRVVDQGERVELRQAYDDHLVWQCESEERPRVTTDAYGWLVHSGKETQSYDDDGNCVATWQGDEEMVSLGHRYCVGRRPLEQGGLWGCPESDLRVAERWTGSTRTLPRDLFTNRTCFVVSGDILWCVCENQQVLRAYNLHSRKVVREISPLPSGPHSTQRDSKIQFLAAYGTDIYLTSKAGLVLGFGLSR